MASYTTKEDVLGDIQMADLISLTDDDETGQLNETVLNKLIESASSLIDSKVSNIYTTPFSAPYPSAVSSACLTIVCYRLFRRREVPDEKNKFYGDYKDVLEWLKAVNKQEAHIDQAPPRTFPQGAASTRTTIYGGNIFGGGLVNSM